MSFSTKKSIFAGELRTLDARVIPHRQRDNNGDTCGVILQDSWHGKEPRTYRLCTRGAGNGKGPSYPRGRPQGISRPHNLEKFKIKELSEYLLDFGYN